MNGDLLKYINEFFNSFKKDHTFYLDGERLRFCKASDIRITWAIEVDPYSEDYEWIEVSFADEEEN
jgi:hypothetical protein